jgi:hypothetical protein
VSQELRTGGRHNYASAIAGLWSGLSHTLSRLEQIAADPDETLAETETLDSLPGLQYTLHAASETVAGIAPPVEAQSSHAELAAALADARDATAEVAEAASSGGVDAAWPLVWEWRGALFRVRLARLRLAPVPEEAAETREPASTSIAVAAVVLVLVGAIVVALGALLGLWPVAAAGMTVVACALLRPWP